MYRGRFMLSQLAWLMPSVTEVSYGESNRLDFDYAPIEEPILDIRLRPTEAARSIVSLFLRDKVKPVSVTVRMSDFQEERNSDLNEMGQAVQWLMEHGYTPIIVPDTDHYSVTGQQPLNGVCYAPACFNVDIRLALQEQCLNNVMTGNGTMFVSMLSDVNYLAFLPLTKACPGNRATHLRRLCVTPDDYWGEGKHLYWDASAKAMIGAMEEYLPFSKPRVVVKEDKFTSAKVVYG